MIFEIEQTTKTNTIYIFDRKLQGRYLDCLFVSNSGESNVDDLKKQGSEEHQVVALPYRYKQ